MSTQVYIDDFPTVDIQDVKRLLGGRRRLREATGVSIHLPGDRDVPVRFTSLPANLGGGRIKYMACPVCERPVRVLRVVPSAPHLMCGRCVRRIYRAMYVSQSRSGDVGNAETPVLQ